MNINTIQPSYLYPIKQSDINNNPSKTSSTNENQKPSDIKKEISSKFAEEQKGGLTKNEEILVQELKEIDQAVKRHETAHVIAGGRFILSGANYSYKTGPDGKRYAVSGEVSIDTSPVPGDPEATIQKMNQIRRAALAPSDPSPQDRKVASTAMTISTKAASELMLEQVKQKAFSDEEKAFGNIKQTADNAYLKVQNMPESQHEPIFKISA